eukprot:Colp12_sorted_trinity150504_noHs@13208
MLPVETLKTIVLSEAHHRAMQIAEIGKFPRMLSWIPSVISQKYEGDVTIVPQIGWKDMSMILSNPSEEILQHCIEVGERSTWPYISIIRTRCKIEVALDECLNTIVGSQENVRDFSLSLSVEERKGARRRRSAGPVVGRQGSF